MRAYNNYQLILLKKLKKMKIKNWNQAIRFSIIVGVIILIYYSADILIIDYFIDLGIREWFCPLILSLILIINTLNLYQKKDIGVFIIKLYILGIFLDRLITSITYWRYTNIIEILFPIIISIPLVFLFKPSDSVLAP